MQGIPNDDAQQPPNFGLDKAHNHDQNHQKKGELFK